MVADIQYSNWRSLFPNLISPLSFQQLISDYWDVSPCVIRMKSQPLFDQLAPIGALAELFGSLPMPVSDWFGLVAEKSYPIGTEFNGPDGSIDLAAAGRAYSTGFTLLLRRVHRRRKELGLLCRSLEYNLMECNVALLDRVGANIYITPPNGRGFEVHYDDHDVFVLQVHGFKRWRIFDRIAGGPHRPPRALTQDALPTRQVDDITLSPGDLLYLPAGYPHDASTTDTFSAHVTIGIHTPSVLDLVAALRQHCGELRHQVHSTSRQGDSVLELELTNLQKKLASRGTIEIALKVIEENTFKRMAPIELGYFGQVLLSNPFPRSVSVELQPGMFGRIHLSEEGWALLVPGRRILVPSSLKPAVEKILEGNRLRLDELPWTTQSECEDFVLEFFRLGILRVFPEP